MFNFHKQVNLIAKSNCKSLDELAVFDLKDQEYIPIFKYQPSIIQNYYNWFDDNTHIKNHLTGKFDHIIPEVENYKNLPFRSLENYQTSDFLSVMRFNQNQYKEYINDKSIKFNKFYRHSSVNTYKELFDKFYNNTFFYDVKLPSTRYLVSEGFIADVENGFQPLIVAVVKRSNLKYLRLCHLTKTVVDPSVIEIWVDNKFYSDDYKTLRIASKKQLGGSLSDNDLLGYKVVRKENLITELFKVPELPTLASIKVKKEFEASLLKNFLIDKTLESYADANNTRFILED